MLWQLPPEAINMSELQLLPAKKELHAPYCQLSLVAAPCGAAGPCQMALNDHILFQLILADGVVHVQINLLM